jgi:hypothetical protein
MGLGIVRNRLRHDVRDELCVGALGRAHERHRLRHARMLGKHELDLAQLDAIAADLYLVVAATKELDRPVR